MLCEHTFAKESFTLIFEVNLFMLEIWTGDCPNLQEETPTIFIQFIYDSSLACTILYSVATTWLLG